MLRLLIQSAAAFAICFVEAAYAQPTLAQMQTDMVTSWLVTVEGEARTRTLRIAGVEQKDAETFSLNAVYGWTDGKQTSVNAQIRQFAQERALTLTTQPGSKIAAKQNPDGTFSGTFTSPSGSTKGIKIAKASEDELHKVAAAYNAPPVIEQPAADVPASCAAFFGTWIGTWSQGNFGRQWLRIVGVDANCSVKLSYRDDDKMQKTFQTAAIKQDALSFLCNRSTGGTCVFTRHGDDLWATYSNPSGGTNNGVFAKSK